MYMSYLWTVICSTNVPAAEDEIYCRRKIDCKIGQPAWHMSLHKDIMSYMRVHYYCCWFYNFDYHAIACRGPFKSIVDARCITRLIQLRTQVEKLPEKLFFVFLVNKEIYWILKARYLTSVFFFTKCRVFNNPIILSFSVQIIRF